MNLTVFVGQFPYDFGEAFFENELPHLAKNFENITLISNGKGKTIREFPNNVKLVSLRETNVFIKTFFVLSAPFRMFFSKLGASELKQIGVRNFTVIRLALLMLYLYHDALINYNIKHHVDLTDKTLFYTFWTNEQSFAITTHDYPNVVGKVSRTHRYDLFYERNRARYLPFRKNIYFGIDEIHFETELAKNYYLEAYAKLFDLSSDNDKKLKVSGLGVAENTFFPSKKERETFSVISVSFVRPVKRLDLIIDSLAAVETDIKIKWTHIGDGKMLDEIKAYAQSKLSSKVNFEFEFLGNLTNDEMRENLARHNYDTFINLSDSEGVPVSIMEAVACGIPVLARNVGGISEICSDQNGVLLETENPQIIAKEIEKLISEFKENSLEAKREQSHELWKRKYSDLRNYEIFIQDLKSNFFND